MRKMLLASSLGLLILSGCANRPESISASYVSHEKYSDLGCEKLATYLVDARQKLKSFSTSTTLVFSEQLAPLRRGWRRHPPAPRARLSRRRRDARDTRVTVRAGGGKVEIWIESTRLQSLILKKDNCLLSTWNLWFYELATLQHGTRPRSSPCPT